MSPTSPAELLSIIQESRKRQQLAMMAYQLDLILILSENGDPESNLCLKMLTWLETSALLQGESLKSWRKEVSIDDSEKKGRRLIYQLN